MESLRIKSDRRSFLRSSTRLVSGALVAESLPSLLAGDKPAANNLGWVEGQPEGAKVGMGVLAGGGNAVDAIVAAALTAAVVSIHNCGIGGYGGHMTIALAGGKQVTSIDFNSMAPAAAKEDMFPLDDKGQVRERINTLGWLASGVPGTLAGLQTALDRYGTRTIRELLQPAVKYAREGFPLPAGMANVIRNSRPQFLKDDGSARLFLRNGEPPKAGATFQNPDLANLLDALARDNSVAAFYHGEIAKQIAESFRKNGGFVTTDDLAAYRAKVVEPLSLDWHDFSIHTAPLTAGGLTVLQALHLVKKIGLEKQDADTPYLLHTRLEALRVAWHDRLKLLGDPDKAKVPIERLMSEPYAVERGRQIREAVRIGQSVPATTDGRTDDGTIHLSASDAKGNLVALTLTHGAAFGAHVTVPGLGLVLGHGMSRFEPRPGHPNSPGPHKRPLHNMCPTIVLKKGKPVLALGGRGGRKIPNAIFEVVTRFVGLGKTMEQAVAGLRLHTEGGMTATLEPSEKSAPEQLLNRIGYKVERAASAVVSAVSHDPESGRSRGVSR